MTRASSLTRAALGAAVLCAIAAPGYSQFNEQWLKYSNGSAAHLAISTSALTFNATETDVAHADLDKNGFEDIVVARKEWYTSTGRRQNVLLMNYGGVLTDMSSTLANTSTVAGDQGFMTPTNDRDVVIADFDGDGWLDVITATTLTDGGSKALGHPRVYMNLGNDVNGVWQGIHYEEARIPQLLVITGSGTGNAENPRFCSVAAGDLTGNGLPDLYFGDYDSGPGGASNADLNDRLLINDGNGFFTDQSALRMTTDQLLSAFGNSVGIEDFNLDGVNDVIKDTSLNFPQKVAIIYNNPQNVGMFNLYHTVSTAAPYHMNTGDLNNDGRLDVVISDDGDDHYQINTGNDAFGRAIWTNNKPYTFVGTGGNAQDDGFASNNLIVDLDGDGWNDSLHCDVDVDLTSGGGRLHMYHNRTSTPGTSNVIMREERENSTSNGWYGAEGLKLNDMRGSHDIAVFDIDNDGDKDLFLSRINGTDVWINEKFTPASCGFTTYGFMASPANTLRLTGSGSAGTGTSINMKTIGINSTVAIQVLSLGQDNFAFLGGIVLVDAGALPIPEIFLTATGGLANLPLDIPADPAFAGLTVYSQVAAPDAGQPGGWALSNGLKLTVCP